MCVRERECVCVREREREGGIEERERGRDRGEREGGIEERGERERIVMPV